ncbi:MAG TPA: DUF3237 domain-containing protein [Polyangiales bacterium]|nr:DUF3237 domain-containing protein [Polyangiales bacterium]
MFLELLSDSGPCQRVRAFEWPNPSGAVGKRYYRTLLPKPAAYTNEAYVPIAALDGEEVSGDVLRIGQSPEVPIARPTQDSRSRAQGRAAPTASDLLPVKLELFARAEAELPHPTVFGPTPEGIRMAFYVTDGRWTGPRIEARYKSEGGDWLLVRKDGIAVPDARATLETQDGALLYYRLTGTLDLGPDGYARTLASDFPDAAPLSVVGQVSTSNERWLWLNRLTLVGSGIVNLKSGHVRYDLYYFAPPASLLAP